MTKTLLPDDHLKKYLIPAFERKAESIVAIDVKNLTSYTDTLVIIGTKSERQLSAIAEHIITSLKKLNIYPLGREGLKEGGWTLLDYGDVIIHIFENEAMVYYNLEGLWADAPRYELAGLVVKK